MKPEKFIKCNFCNGLGYSMSRLGKRICLICEGEKYIPAKKGYAKYKLNQLK